MSGTTHGDSLPDGKGAWRRFDSIETEDEQ